MPDSLHWRSFVVPKDGHAAAECEDAVAGDPAAGRFAVADGASESFAAGEWARLLVDAFVGRGPARDWLARPRADWQKAVAGQAVSWYAEEKLAAGGHATFLGLTTTPVADQFDWEAVAVGDACVFHVVGGSLLSSFPLDRPGDFTSSPTLISSRGGNPNWKARTGVLRPGEALLLATDALAQCLLGSANDGRFAGPGFLTMDHDDDFALWVAVARAAGKLRNDDVALGIVEFVPEATGAA
jgi:protein phosphatase 2C-like protein